MNKVLLIVIVAQGCSIENVDRTTVTMFDMPSMEVCEAHAIILDDLRNQRATCIERATEGENQ